MLVMISGKQGSGKTTLANALQTYWAQRGHASWITQFEKPAQEIHDAIYMIGKRYDVLPPMDKDEDLIQLIYHTWGRSKDKDIWTRALKKYIDKVTADWRRKELIHFTIIDDLKYRNCFDAFPEALTIRLECTDSVRMERSEHRRNHLHPSEVDLDPYAAGGKFDIVVDTSKETEEESVKRITDYVNNRLNEVFKK